MQVILAEPREPGLQWTKLCDCNIFPVCSPALIKDLGRHAEPSDVLNYTLMRVYTAADHWSVWFEQNGMEMPDGNAQLSFDSYILACEAAMERQGVAMVIAPLGAPDLDGERLVRFSDADVTLPQSWYMVCRPERSSCESPGSRTVRISLRVKSPVIVLPSTIVRSVTRSPGCSS